MLSQIFVWEEIVQTFEPFVKDSASLKIPLTSSIDSFKVRNANVSFSSLTIGQFEFR